MQLRATRLTAIAHAARKAAAFNPSSLFSAGEQGWWFDPSNLSTLFQDSGGTTPVTAVEQPVGLQLDLSKGLVLGAELVTNGDFSGGTTTGWSAYNNSTLAVVSGELSVSSGSGTFGAAGQTITTTVGVTYKFSVKVRRGTASSVFIQVKDSPTDINAVSLFSQEVTSTSDTIVSGVFRATKTGHLFGIVNNSSGGSSFSDNISVKELPGNHRFQSTSANRPVVSARVNLFTRTEDFSNAVWVKSNSTITSNTTIAPDGTNTADTLTDNATASFHSVFQEAITAASGVYTGAISLKQDTARYAVVSLATGSGAAVRYSAVVDLQTGQITQNNSLNSPVSPSSFISPEANGYYKVSVSLTSSATTGYLIVAMSNTATPTVFAANTLDPVYIGSGQTIQVWGGDFRPANQGVGLPAYQRVNTSTDYDSVGFPTYIKPNGGNQFMVTNSINFSSTDKTTVWQGVRSLTGGVYGPLIEFSNNADSNTGTFLMSGNGNLTTYRVAANSRGTLSAAAITNSTSYNPPITLVQTLIGDISGDVATLRLNATQVATSTTDQGTGNYGNYPAYFYARGNLSFYFNGHDYGSIARGAASTAAQIAAAEAWINQRTKAF